MAELRRREQTAAAEGRGRHRARVPRPRRRHGRARRSTCDATSPACPPPPPPPGAVPSPGAQPARDLREPSRPRATGAATLDAVYPDARNPFAFPELLEEGLEPWTVPEVYVMTLTEGDVIIDITDTIDRKIQALLCHESQIADPAGRAELLRELGRVDRSDRRAARRALRGGVPPGRHRIGMSDDLRARRACCSSATGSRPGTPKVGGRVRRTRRSATLGERQALEAAEGLGRVDAVWTSDLLRHDGRPRWSPACTGCRCASMHGSVSVTAVHGKASPGWRSTPDGRATSPTGGVPTGTRVTPRCPPVRSPRSPISRPRTTARRCWSSRTAASCARWSDSSTTRPEGRRRGPHRQPRRAPPGRRR